MSPDADLWSLQAYEFALPPELIAQQAVEPRHAARLLAVTSQGRSHAHVSDLPMLLLAHYRRPPLLIVNDTKVVAARLQARKPSGGAVQLLLERPFGAAGDTLRAQPVLFKASKALQVGQTLTIDGGGTATVQAVLGGGRAVVDFAGVANLAELLDRAGHVPLPPYIRGGVDVPHLDRPRYQCTYAAVDGAVAAPTAGLHFSTALRQELEQAGIGWAAVTLHVGPGTFLPVRSDDLHQHTVQAERYAVSEATAEAFNRAKRDGQPIVAVGTTTTRVLEHAAAQGQLQAGAGETGLTIAPGHRFAAIDGLMTNFHLPQSSLLVLVCAFAGFDRVMAAYRDAVGLRYRFYSYGDACLFL